MYSDLRDQLLTATATLRTASVDALRTYEEAVTAAFAAHSPAAQLTRVPAGGDLQAALDRGGTIVLEPGATYQAQRFTVSRATTIHGNEATLVGTAGPALYVRPGTHYVEATDLLCLSSALAVVQLGDNVAETQSQMPDVPTHISLSRVRIPQHRNRRAFEINAAAAALVDCAVEDCYDPAGSDSQAVCILNTPGPVMLAGGRYSAGSEIVMVGGDTMKLPGVIPTGIDISRVVLWRPLSWRTDGVRRVTKTGLEFKTGRNCRVTDLTIDHCYRDGQDGYGVTITPRRAGAIADIVFDRLLMRNVGGGFNITGHDSPGKPPTPELTGAITVLRSRIETDSKTLGGRGCLVQLTMAPRQFTIRDSVILADGTTLVYGGDKEPIGRVEMTGCIATATKYGFMFAGRPYARTWQYTPDAGGVEELIVTGNTFGDAAAEMTRNLPANRYVDRAALDALAFSLPTPPEAAPATP